MEIDSRATSSVARLSWLVLTCYEEGGKAIVEIKREGQRSAGGDEGDMCRFCGCELTAESRQIGDAAFPALEKVCSEEECQEKAKASCTQTLQCGHPCCGVRGETKCLPCLRGCGGPTEAGHTLDADEYCTICYTEPLGMAPSIMLDCGHAFHADCVRSLLKARWPTARISFEFQSCPLCKRAITANPALDDLLAPLVKLRAALRKKALMRLTYEGKDKNKDLTDPESVWHKRPEDYAEDLFAYYQCFKCKQPYYGGERACGAAGDADFNPADLMCSSCVPHSHENTCDKHGTDFIQYKCRFCCTPAVWFCGGTTHYCDPCHSGGAVVGPCPWVHGKVRRFVLFGGDRVCVLACLVID